MFIKLKNFFQLSKFTRSDQQEFNKLVQWYNLSFKRNSLEQEFITSDKARITFLYKLSILIQILSSIIFILQGQTMEKYLLPYFRTGFICHLLIQYILFNFFLNKKSVKFQRIFIAFYQLLNSLLHTLMTSYFISIVQFNKPYTKILFNQLVITGIITGLGNILYLLTCPYWYIQSIITISTSFILVGIQMQFKNYDQWVFYFLIFLICLLLRYMEYYIRLDFFFIRKEHSNLISCKNIFDKTVPSSIIVLGLLDQQDNSAQLGILENDSKKFELLYTNQSSLINLKVQNEGNILDKLKEIMILNKQENLYQVISQSFHNDEQIITSQTNDIEQDYLLQIKGQTTSNYKKLVGILSPSQIHYNISILPCVWEKKKSLLILMNDISEKIRIKYLKEINQYKDQLLATVSHDLKTPLNGMILSVQIIQESLQNEQLLKQNQIQEIQSFMQDFYQNSLLLLSMINDLLDYSQIQKGTLRLCQSFFKVEKIFSSINTLLEKQAIIKQIKLNWHCNFEKDIDQYIYSDENRLKQILINLIGNAIKFTIKGSVDISARREGEYIVFKVQDTGLGIPNDIQPQLFQLYKTFNIGSQNQHGVGLGLVISKKLIELLGPENNLSFTSQEGIGTEFQFRIKRSIDESMEIAENFGPEKNKIKNIILSSPKTIQKERKLKQILIVDDTPFNIQALTMLILKIKKFNILKAFSGLEALQEVSQNKIDIVLMDVNMPMMDGYECTRKMRELQKQGVLNDFRIIIITAFTNENDKQNSIACGADEHLNKPVMIKELNSVFQKFNLL